MNQKSLSDAVSLFQINKSAFVSVAKLKQLLPTVELAIFFGKVYSLDYYKLSELLGLLFNTDVISALRDGGHSTELQSYLIDTIPSSLLPEVPDPIPAEDLPSSEVMVQLFESITIQVAQSIKEVGNKLGSVLSKMPSKEGSMVFQTMLKMNRNRPTIGVHAAAIQHKRVDDVAVVLDVSGSMTETTVRAILEDVLALTYSTNAHLMTVSNRARHWEPGSASMDAVLKTSEYGGTCYEQLVPMFNREWGTVVTIADYDSSAGAKRALAQCTGHIGQILDISLVNRPTYLGECLGQLADSIEPLLIGKSAYVSRY